MRGKSLTCRDVGPALAVYDRKWGQRPEEKNISVRQVKVLPRISKAQPKARF
jgi:hypothetical protein